MGEKERQVEGGRGTFRGTEKEEVCACVRGADGVAGSVEDSGEHPYRPQIWTIVGGSCLALLQTKPIVS